MLDGYKGVKSPELSMNATVQIFIDFISPWHRYLKFILSCLSTHVSLENLAKLAALCLIQDQVHLLWKKNKWISIFNILLPFYIFYWFKSKKKLIASSTLYELHYSATTSWNIYCSKPMYLLGLGNKFGARIINKTKTTNKEPAFSFINKN